MRRQPVYHPISHREHNQYIEMLSIDLHGLSIDKALYKKILKNEFMDKQRFDLSHREEGNPSLQMHKTKVVTLHVYDTNAIPSRIIAFLNTF